MNLSIGELMDGNFPASELTNRWIYGSWIHWLGATSAIHQSVNWGLVSLQICELRSVNLTHTIFYYQLYIRNTTSTLHEILRFYTCDLKLLNIINFPPQSFLKENFFLKSNTSLISALYDDDIDDKMLEILV